MTPIALLAGTSAAAVLALALLAAHLRRRLDAAEARLGWLAVTDELTELASRRAITAALEDELRRAGRYGRPLSVVLLDLDRFRQVNEAHGQQAGDAVLRAVAGALRGELRREDRVGRWDGEEFLVLLPETDGLRGRAIAERLREAVERLRVEHGGRALAVTTSVGVADNAHPSTRTHSATAELMVKLADTALYRAKGAGRNRVEVLEAADL